MVNRRNFIKNIGIASIAVAYGKTIPDLILASKTTITGIQDLDTLTIHDHVTIKAEKDITLINGSTVQLSGSANYCMKSGDTVTLIMNEPGAWAEIARSYS